MPAPSLSLVVIRSAKPEATLAFYRALGCNFVEEKHGSGPIHYSCEIGSTLLEVYPGDANGLIRRNQSGATMLGFSVLNLDEVMSRLAGVGAETLTPPRKTSYGLRATVTDPDGRAVNLAEAE